MSDSTLNAERLILDVTEGILTVMERRGVDRTQLAARLGKSKGHVSQLLDGRRNMTLRTLAEIATSLEVEARVTLRDAEADDLAPDDRRWFCAWRDDLGSDHRCKQGIPTLHKTCGWRLLVPVKGDSQ